MINLKDFPKSSGCYLFLDKNKNVIYIGSTGNIQHRLSQHKSCIKIGSNRGSQKEFYNFLQSNEFTVEYIITENYKEKEQELLEQYHPHFNRNKADTGIIATNAEDYHRQWREKNREAFLSYKTRYNKQKCIYNGKETTLNALTQKFYQKGVEHATTEAKKYLIKEEE